MTKIELKLESLQQKLAKRSATYAVTAFVPLPDEDSDIKTPPQFDATNAEMCKSLYIIGVSRILLKIKGWVVDYSSDADKIVVTLNIDEADGDFVKRLIEQCSEAYLFAEVYSTYSSRMSKHFKDFADEVAEALVAYLAVMQ